MKQHRALDHDTFVARFGGIYEHSPWVADTAFRQGMDGSDPLALIDVMRFIVERSGRESQITLLRAHPDLAGKLAIAGNLTPESTSEQAGAGLDQCTPAEFAEFQHLNTAYKDRFHFPFILAVRGHTRATILEQFRKRIENTPVREFRAALDQVHRIARFRIEALLEN